MKNWEKADWVTYALTFVPLVLLRGIVIQDLWSWFVVPIGVQPVVLAQALGIAVLVSLLTSREWGGVEQVEKPAVDHITRSLSISLAFWLTGWIYSLFL